MQGFVRSNKGGVVIDVIQQLISSGYDIDDVLKDIVPMATGGGAEEIDGEGGNHNGSGAHDTGSGTHDTGSDAHDTGSGSHDTGSGSHDTGSGDHYLKASDPTEEGLFSMEGGEDTITMATSYNTVDTPLLDIPLHLHPEDTPIDSAEVSPINAPLTDVNTPPISLSNEDHHCEPHPLVDQEEDSISSSLSITGHTPTSPITSRFNKAPPIQDSDIVAIRKKKSRKRTAKRRKSGGIS